MMDSRHKTLGIVLLLSGIQDLAPGQRETNNGAVQAGCQVGRLGSWTDILGVWLPKHRLSREVRRRLGWEDSSVSKVHVFASMRTCVQSLETHMKKLGTVAHTSNPNVEEADRWISWAHWSASLAEWVSPRQPHLKRWTAPEQHHLRLSSCFYMHTHIFVHAPISICLQINVFLYEHACPYIRTIQTCVYIHVSM